MAAWAERTPSVSGLILIGSRVRFVPDHIEYSDAYSDWDFQIITSNPQMFADREWTQSLVGAELKAYAVRFARIGAVPKINMLFVGAEADMVIIPARIGRLMRLLVALGFHRRPGWTQRRLQDLAEVIRPGWRFLKGGNAWNPLFQHIVASVPDPRLTDKGAKQLAEGFVCDYVWCLRKIARGELRATQRILYQELMETNLQLLHELKRRRGERTFTKARRIENITSSAELASVSVTAPLQAVALRDELEKSAVTCREMMRLLVGDLWRWPDVQ